MSDSKVTSEDKTPGDAASKASGADATTLQSQLEAALAELDQRKQIETDLRAQLASAKTEDDFNKAQQQWETQVAEMNVALARANVMREYNLPDSVGALLVGTNEAELRKSAQALVDFRGEPAPVPGHETKRSGAGTGGTSAQAPDLPIDPRKLAEMVPRGGLVL